MRKKRFVFLVLVLCLSLIPAHYSGAFAAAAEAEIPDAAVLSSELSASEIQQQIRTTYRQSLQNSGLSSFNGWCATYVNQQLVVLGINTSYVGADGNGEFDIYKDLSQSSGGYPITAFPANQYSLNSALNTISENGTKNVYNILVGFEKGTGSAGLAFGHTCFIHAIIGGTVYYSESFGATIGGKYYSEGDPIVCSIATFSGFYSGYVLDGVIAFGSLNGGPGGACQHENGYTSTGYCKDCNQKFDYESTSQEVNAYYTVSLSPSITLRSEPYSDAEKLSTVISKNTEVVVLRKVRNAFNNEWAEIKYNGVTGWSSFNNISFSREFDSSFSCNVTSPRGTVDAGKPCDVSGEITSARTITEISAWVVNSSGETVLSKVSHNPGGKSFSLYASPIDRGLHFENITRAGNYELKITINDDRACSNVFSFPFTVRSSGAEPEPETAYGYYPACASSYASIVDGLNSIGVDSSYSNRSRIAAANGISGYSGTAEQNTKLLELLKQGKLKDPDSIMAFLDVNGMLDGEITPDLGDVGVFEIYISDVPVGSGLNDYYAELPVGTYYWINPLSIASVNSAYEYKGFYSGTNEGRVEEGGTKIVLQFDRKTVKLSFSANGGTGSMSSASVSSGSEYTLPSCLFNAPAGKQFKAWSVNGSELLPGAKLKVSSDSVVKAVWEKADEMQSIISEARENASGTGVNVTVPRNDASGRAVCAIYDAAGKMIGFTPMSETDGICSAYFTCKSGYARTVKVLFLNSNTYVPMEIPRILTVQAS